MKLITKYKKCGKDFSFHWMSTIKKYCSDKCRKEIIIK